MASTRRKSAAVALAVVGVAGLTLASAAQLNLTTASLGAGSEIVASCDTDGIDVDFTTTLSGGQYVVTEVVLSDIAAECQGLDVQGVLLTGAAGSQTQLGAELTDVVDGATLAITVANQPASAVTGVSLVISG